MGSRFWSLPALALALGVALAAGIATPAPTAEPRQLAQKSQNERGSAIGTPLPVAKVEPAPIAPPPYSDAEKAALAKLDAATAELQAAVQKLADQEEQLRRLATAFLALLVSQIVVLAIQFRLLRRRRRTDTIPAKAAEAGPETPPPGAAS
ncbi:MAG TPA: hypothetical protein VN970_04610 [Thermoanaerobaculia bacterium]|nr:hypothetical protein [Thermoanaerobaculia bacterium]